MEKLSWELLIYHYVSNVSEQQQCQPEWKQMEISAAQVSNGFIQTEWRLIYRMMSPSDAVVLGRPCNSLFEFQVVHRYVFIVI